MYWALGGGDHARLVVRPVQGTTAGIDYLAGVPEGPVRCMERMPDVPAAHEHTSTPWPASLPGGQQVGDVTNASTAPLDDRQDWHLLLNEVFKERNIDFSQYREGLMKRRVMIRLRATQCATYEQYLQHLKGNRDEMDALLDALTINVTQFFRDPPVFQAIQARVIPALFTPGRLAEGPIRVWSCGASAGEEAMTVLILIAEYLQQDLDPLAVRIYGTDIDRWSIEQAKTGVYDEYEFATMPTGWQAKYFLDMGNKRWWRRKEYNQYFSFEQRDIVNGEPLQGVDLILCRNLFIYFKRELQERCLEKFARALRPGGFLVMGLTESLWNPVAGLFDELDRVHRVYRKR